MSEVKRYDIDGSDYRCYEDSRGEYVKFSDIEKMVKLWEMVRPIGLYCGTCQHVPEDNRDYCSLFNNYGKGRCQQCIDIFGGDV